MMRLPYLDKVHPSALKVKTRVALIALPILIGTAACYPAYLFVLQIFPLIGVNPDLPLDTQNLGAVAVVVLLVVVLAGFFLGSLVGFFANTAVCRYLLKWDKSKVDAVFYDQEIPENWRKNQQS